MYKVLVKNASVVDGTGAPKTPDCVGKSVRQYARELGRDEFEVYFDLIAANGQEATAAYFNMSDEDLERVLLHPASVICTDSFNICGDKPCHPRAFGSFPLCLGKYVWEKKLMTLEAMVHKMTQASAEFMDNRGKGVIADGYDADLVLAKRSLPCILCYGRCSSGISKRNLFAVDVPVRRKPEKALAANYPLTVVEMWSRLFASFLSHGKVWVKKKFPRKQTFYSDVLCRRTGLWPVRLLFNWVDIHLRGFLPLSLISSAPLRLSQLFPRPARNRTYRPGCPCRSNRADRWPDRPH